jgi:hypothetical protein
MGARVVPEVVEEDRTYGVEPGGGVRAIAAGIRVVSMPSGAVLAADEKLPQLPNATLALPDRLGGGFLFVLGTNVWRADKWLSEARPVYNHSTTIGSLVPGLDRVYVRSGSGGYTAIDPRSGQRVELGPWPGGPTVAGYAALDGWRAAAIVDLRGAVVTNDAGASWKSIELPILPQTLVPLGDSVVVSGRDPGGTPAWYEVRPEGGAARLAGPPKLPSAATPMISTMPAEAKPFGKRPLLAVVEDGWPLTDGTAVVARDGALARVRLSDGALLEVAGDAFPMKPSRCHAISLNRPTALGAFGFVCGEARGPTVLYAYDPNRGVLVELKRFDRPRMVLSSGNGAIAVRGGCGERDPADDKGAEHTYCLLPLDSRWREIHVRGEIGDERLVVLSDGRIAIVSPPRGDLATARVTILDKGKASTVPIVFTSPPAEVAKALRLGVWMEGFEERRDGVIGGWVEAGGVVLGIEIALDGAAKFGQFIRDAGAPVVSGRYGLGWSGSRRGYETIDGGMTWASVDVPEPISTGRPVSRACGPIGCTAAGWLRVGWGPGKKSAPKDAPPVAQSSSSRSTLLDLVCEPAAPAPPPVPAVTKREAAAERPISPRHVGLAAIGSSYTPSQELQPFNSVAPPALHADERGISADATETTGSRAPLARYYAWGPKTGDWDRTARWLVRWMSPFGGAAEVSSTTASAPPQLILDLSRVPTTPYGYGYGYPYSGYGNVGLIIGDDAKHALLTVRRYNSRDLAVFALEADRSPLELRRGDGEPFTIVDAAVRSGDHWYLASAPEGEVPYTLVWQVDGAVAREITRIPRIGADARATTTVSPYGYPTPYNVAQQTGARMARRSDGRAVGFVVDGQSGADSRAQRWVLPIDVESGAAQEPELLGPTDMSDRTLVPCLGDEPGWVLDAPLSQTVRLQVGARSASVYQPLARLRVSRQSACVERITGSADGFGGDTPILTKNGRTAGAKLDGPSVLVAAAVSRTRYPLRCVRRSSAR